MSHRLNKTEPILKPLICDLPYPAVENVEKDAGSGRILSFAFCGLQGEPTSILQYVCQEICFRKINAEIADTLLSIALAEMKHLHIIGQTMEKLGVHPQFLQKSGTYFNASKVCTDVSPQKMLIDDVYGEMNAIAEYKKMLFVLKNPKVAEIIQRIIADEELHLLTLKQLQNTLYEQ